MADALVAGLLLVPAAGALLAPLARRVASTRRIGLAFMLVALALALRLFATFDPAHGPSTIDVPLLPGAGIALRFGADGLNLYLVLLTALLCPAVLAAAWRDEARRPLHVGLLLALEACLLGTFLAQDLVVLFVLWEAVLIPMLLLILVFGGDGRRRAALVFFLATMAGSILFLAAVLVLGHQALVQTGAWAFDFATLGRLKLAPSTEAFVFAALVLACAVKTPLVPFHAWLPIAYTESSPAGAALMAGVLSKMGAYGFLKLAIPLCPTLAPRFAPWLAALAVASILYGAVLALRQQDYRRLVAYASLSHMGYIVLGLFALNATGVHGAMLQMASHGVVVAGLFLLLGYGERRSGRACTGLDALADRAPRYAVVAMLFVLASLALPLTSGFAAEFLVLLGAFTRGFDTWSAGGSAAMLVVAVLASTGVVLGAAYMLRFARALVLGARRPGADALPDLSAREVSALLPLLAVVLALGVWPSAWMRKAEPAVARVVRVAAAPAVGSVAPPAPAGARDAR